jgi:two-component sensor histidine kinase
MTLAEDSSALLWSESHLRAATDAAGVALWSWNVDTDDVTLDRRACELWGIPTLNRITFETLSARIHPQDLDRVRTAFTATRGIVGSYEIDFRIIVDDVVRWVSARGKGDDENIRAGVMFGIFLDVTQRKLAEEAHELIAGEMSHRVKNLLAVASALTQVTSHAATTQEMAKDLTNRLITLGRVQDLVRPAPGQERRAVLMADLLTILLSPYDGSGDTRRIRVAAPKINVGETASTALALVIHELATNSAKYGALSVATGLLDVTCAEDESEVVVVWTERGGPTVAAPDKPPGYGSRMIARTLSAQLGGAISMNWSSEGVIATVRLNESRLAS